MVLSAFQSLFYWIINSIWRAYTTGKKIRKQVSILILLDYQFYPCSTVVRPTFHNGFNPYSTGLSILS